jgi:hypothetical protein
LAAIPVPLVFGKGQFESGVAAKVLREFAQDPFPHPKTGYTAKNPARPAATESGIARSCKFRMLLPPICVPPPR